MRTTESYDSEEEKRKILAKYEVAHKILMGAHADMDGQVTFLAETLEDFLDGYKLILGEMELSENTDEELNSLRTLSVEQAKKIQEQAGVINSQEALIMRIGTLSAKSTSLNSEIDKIVKKHQLPQSD